MSSQELILMVLVIAIALGVFYMLDPTMGGIVKALRREGFESEHFSGPSSMNGEQPGQFQNAGFMDSEAVKRAPSAVMEGFEEEEKEESEPTPEGFEAEKPDEEEGFQNMNPSPMPFAAAEKQANCYPKNQLAAQELLPNDPNSKWAQVNPMGSGDIAGKNFLNAGALIGVNTVGQSLRNASWDLRSEPPNPQVQVSPWMQSTIEPELQRRPLEIA